VGGVGGSGWLRIRVAAGSVSCGTMDAGDLIEVERVAFKTGNNSDDEGAMFSVDASSRKQRAPSKKDKQREREIAKLESRKRMREEKLKEDMKDFERKGPKAKLDKTRNVYVRHEIKNEQEFQQQAVESAARAAVLLTETEGFLEPEHDMEKTFKVSQKEMREMSDINTASKLLDLQLTDQAPYRLSWTKNGRYLALGGHRGHVTVIDALRNQPKFEIQLQETVRDVTFLHNEAMVAVAQKKYVYIYNDTGAEVHRLRSHVRPERLEFLPYHYLLASVGRTGYLKYQDISTGELVSEHRTRQGMCNVMTQNPYNAVVCLGHSNGTVSMWSPSSPKPLVSMFCHDGPLGAVAVSPGGNELITAGRNGKLSIWDVRTYKRIHSYHTPKPAHTIDISQRGLMAVGCGHQVQIWKDALRTKQKAMYMNHKRPGDVIEHVKFRPYEDILGVGHSAGFQSILIPGAGVANFDAFEANPFENSKQRREKEVHGLLEKLQPDMIVLNPSTIGTIDRATPEELQQERMAEAAANASEAVMKNKQRGKSKIGNKIKRKHLNIVTAERQALRAKYEAEKKAKEAKESNKPVDESKTGPVFSRFAR